MKNYRIFLKDNYKLIIILVFISLLILAGCKENSSRNSNVKDNPGTIPTSPDRELSISGAPLTKAYVNDGGRSDDESSVDVYTPIEYFFQPTVTKSNDSDVLTFMIENKPRWAVFDQRTGSLTGIPRVEHRGFYDNISISVTDGVHTVHLSPRFSIEVTPWRGFGFCLGRQKDGRAICTSVSFKTIIQAHCEAWASGQRLDPADAEIHIDDFRSDTLETLADSLCDIREPTYNRGCPAGSREVPQEVGSPRCMTEDLTDAEIIERIENGMVSDLDDYLQEVENNPLPDFTPLEPILTEPDSDGNRIVILPPPLEGQVELEKRRRKTQLEYDVGDLGDLTNCSAEINQGNSWNRSVCYSWRKTVGDNQFRVTPEIMAYMRMSGDAVASFGVHATLLGHSALIFNAFTKLQIYTLPDSVLTAADIISQADSRNPDETLHNILARPELQDEFANLIDPSIISALEETKTKYERLKAEIDEAVSKTQADIENTKNALIVAKTEYEEAKKNFITAKDQVEKGLPTLNVEKTEFLSKVEYLDLSNPPGLQTIDIIEPQVSQGNEPLSITPKSWNDSITFFSVQADFVVVVVPVTVSAELIGIPSLEVGAGIFNPLDKNEASAFAYAKPGFKLMGVGKGGVGNAQFASAGLEIDLTVANADMDVQFIAEAKDFPANTPLIRVDWGARLLDGIVNLYAEVKDQVLTLVKTQVKTLERVLNWLGRVVGERETIKIVDEWIPEIKIKRYEKLLFNWDGFRYPEVPSCENGVPNRQLLYCNRPNHPRCADTCSDNAFTAPPIGGRVFIDGQAYSVEDWDVVFSPADSNHSYSRLLFYLDLSESRSMYFEVINSYGEGDYPFMRVGEFSEHTPPVVYNGRVHEPNLNNSISSGSLTITKAPDGPFSRSQLYSGTFEFILEGGTLVEGEFHNIYETGIW